MSKDPSLYGRISIPSRHNPDGRCDNFPTCTKKKCHHTHEEAKICKNAAQLKA
jgi:hypothetical protein